VAAVTEFSHGYHSLLLQLPADIVHVLNHGLQGTTVVDNLLWSLVVGALLHANIQPVVKDDQVW